MPDISAPYIGNTDSVPAQKTGSFWYWLVFAVTGLILFRFVPDKAKMYLLVILILGGTLSLTLNGGKGISDLLNKLKGNKT